MLLAKGAIMKIEEEIFQKSKVKEETLLPYGFVKGKKGYHYAKKFMNNTFQADIWIDPKGKVTGKVYDLEVGEEYTNFRLDSMTGEFVGTVREEYGKILKDILNHCFEKTYFQSDQANRITHLINEKYQVLPEFLWEKFKGYGAFREKRTRKWFAIIMNVDKSRIVPEEKGIVEVLNVKLGNQTASYLKKKGLYPAFHSSKKNWVSVILDDTLTDKEIMVLVDVSFQNLHERKEWVVPANPKYYDVFQGFQESDTILWKQSTNISVGDLIYLYLGAPYSAILFQCEAIEVNIPYEYHKQVSIHKVMKIKKLKEYPKEAFPFEKLKSYGLTSVRSPRRIPDALRKELHKD